MKGFLPLPIFRQSWLTSLIIAVFSIFLTASCMKDKCDDKDCQNDAACVNGSCICPDWYEGEDCEKRLTDRFIGSYEGVYNCAILDTIVLVVSESDEVVQQFNMINFQMTGSVTAQNKFDIPEQNFTHPVTQAVIKVSGTGTVNEGSIWMNFRGVDDPSFICSFQGTTVL